MNWYKRGPDKNYKVESINLPPTNVGTLEDLNTLRKRPAYYSVNLLAIETQRRMPNVNLFNPMKQNQPSWRKA